jgi:ABC-type Na+ efflux pump permease subunit
LKGDVSGMKGILSIISKEWKCFIGSDRGLFFFYGFLVVSWSLFLAFREQPDSMTAPWWLIFFSVVVTANFSNTVFISERINGFLEIVISSGYSRMTILTGKILFILMMSSILGLVCVVAGTITRSYLNNEPISINIMDLCVYIVSAVFNTTGAAFLSVRMTNPRLLHIANMVMLTLLIIIHSVMSQFFDVPNTLLSALILLFGIIFFLAAVREFKSERILRPVDM